MATTNPIMARQSAVNRLIHTLLPARSNKGKEKEITIDVKLMPLYEQARQATHRIMNELSIRSQRVADDKEFFNIVSDYRRLYEKCERNGDLSKLELLTATFDIVGAVDLMASKIDIDVLVAYSLQGLCQFDIPREHQITFEFYVGSDRNAPELFETPGIEFDELRNYYTYCVSLHDQSYWLCSSTGWYYSPSGYCFITNKRRLTTDQMWHEINEAHKEGHHLYDEDCEPLTRSRLMQSISGSKL